MKTRIGIIASVFALALVTLIVPSIYLHGQGGYPAGLMGNVGWTTGNTFTNTGTVTAPQLVGVLTGTPTSAATYTTDTAVNICAAFPYVGASQSSNWTYDFYVKNTSAGANTITFAGGTGVTMLGTGTAAQNAARHFKVALNTCPQPGTTTPTAAVTLYSLETATF